MARLPTSGATVVAPFMGKESLQKALIKLCPGANFSEVEIDDVYLRLGQIIGQWSAEANRLDTGPLIKTLMAMSEELNKVTKILSGHETGFRKIQDIRLLSQLREILALDPQVGSPEQADKLMTSFRGDAAKLAHACLVAARDLKISAKGKGGRTPLDWHDAFTALLLEIADAAGVKPRLSKDRISGARGGWLFEAARALERFLYPDMRSKRSEARGKRLERSKTRLKHRQNPSSA